MKKWRSMSKRERRAWLSVLLVGPLGFMAVGVAFSGIAAGSEGQAPAAVVGVALALLLAFWLGRRSKGDNTAVAVAQAVSLAVADARADATAAALAQAHQQVAVMIGDRHGAFDADGQMVGLHDSAHQLAYSDAITSIRDGKPPEGELSNRQARVLEGWPFAGAERVPDPQARFDHSTGEGRLARRGDASGDPVEALQHAQAPRTPG